MLDWASLFGFLCFLIRELSVTHRKPWTVEEQQLFEQGLVNIFVLISLGTILTVKGSGHLFNLRMGLHSRCGPLGKQLFYFPCSGPFLACLKLL